MIQLAVSDYLVVLAFEAELHKIHDRQMSDPAAQISRTEMQDLRQYYVKPVQDFCKKIPLPGSLQQITHLSTDLTMHGSMQISALMALALAFLRVLRDELYSLQCAVVRHPNVKFFGQKQLFGEAVAKSFPSAAIDIENAGNCLALELPDATIYQLMRDVEYGLRALANHLQVPVASGDLEFEGWDRIIRQIYSEVKTRTESAQGTPKEKSELREYYNGIMSEFSGFKDVWRNNIMHTRNHYESDEAQAAFERVRAFMERLATKVSEVP